MLFIDDKLAYEGYKGLGIDGFDEKKLIDFKKFLIANLPDTSFDLLETQLNSLETLDIDNIKELAYKFLNKYFTIHNVRYLNDSKSNMDRVMRLASKTQNAEDFYRIVNFNLQNISPFDLPIEFVKYHSMASDTFKPYICTPVSFTEPNREVYFAKMVIGEQLTLLSSVAIVHEIAHMQQEKNIGYADDYLHRDVISILLEKIMASEVDKSGELLKLCEKVRFSHIINCFNNIHDDECFSHVKSFLLAEKLFDLYQNENNKYKYFDDIQSVFDGNETVEDFLRKRNVTIEKSQDHALLKRHFKS